jgi:hypothetical protein
MKTIHSIVLVLVVSVLFFASAKPVVAGQSQHSRDRDEIFANSLADGGCVRMKHSPALGINVPIAIKIDGVQAGVFAKGHVFERFLTPGRHKLSAHRPINLTDTFRGYIDVRRGETYSFVVKCTVNQVYLEPVGRVE